MRPIPAKKHHWAAAVLVAFVAGNTLLSFRQIDVSEDQANMLAEVFKDQDPLLYPHDPIFAEAGRGAAWRARLPAWRGLLSSALRLVGSEEPLNAFRLIGAAALLVYLVFMYLLLYRQTHSTSSATLVAVISVAIFSIKRPYWGLGPIFAATPANVYLAAVPLLALLFLNSRKRWAVVGVFFLAGLAGNVHLPSAMNLVAVMLLALLALERLRPRAWAVAIVCLAAAAAGAAPALYYYELTFHAAGLEWPAISMPALRGVLQLGGINFLYPAALEHVLRWLPVAVVLAAPAAIILSRAGRYRVSDLPGWLWLLAAALLVALGLHGLSQLVGRLLGTRPPVIGFFDALRLAMLPLYVLFAQATVHLMRLTRRHRSWVRAGLGLLAAVYLGSSHNTRPLRHMVQDFIVDVAQEHSPATARPRDSADRELRLLARWADHHTPSDALFVADRPEIRPYGRRSLLCCQADVRYLYHFAPGRLSQWAWCLREQRALLKPTQSARADAAAIAAFVDAHWQRGGGLAAPTYLLIRAEAAPAPTDRLEEITPPGGIWGQYWRLFLVRPAGPATIPTLTTRPEDT